MDKLGQLIHNVPAITTLQRTTEDRINEISHGTLCVAMLIEALEAHNILEETHITHLSISDGYQPRSYMGLQSSLKYCVERKPDLVSISVGIYGRNGAKELNKILPNLNETLFVAAASNTFQLTYPAALPTVLGVKQLPSYRNIRYSKSLYIPDGIDLLANLKETPLMKNLKKDYGIDCTGSNSVLIPQVSAEIVAQSIEKGKKPTKYLALNWLAQNISAEFDFYFPRISGEDEDNKVPIILFPYQDGEKKEVIQKAFQLKRAFESRMDSCSIISDLFTCADFVTGYYRLDTKRPADCISYYQYAVSDSLILVFAKTDVIKDCPYDLLISDWRDISIQKLCFLILQKFPEEEDNENE